MRTKKGRDRNDNQYHIPEDGLLVCVGVGVEVEVQVEFFFFYS